MIQGIIILTSVYYLYVMLSKKHQNKNNLIY